MKPFEKQTLSAAGINFPCCWACWNGLECHRPAGRVSQKKAPAETWRITAVRHGKIVELRRTAVIEAARIATRLRALRYLVVVEKEVSKGTCVG